MEDVSPLIGSELFSNLGEEALARVAVKASTLAARAQRHALQRGRRSRRPLRGPDRALAIAKRSPDGRESLVALMEPGDIFGEMPLFDDEPRSASARALERSEVVRVPFEASAFRAGSSAGADVGRRGALSPAGCGPPTTPWPTPCCSTSLGAPPRGCSSCRATLDEFVLPITQEELAGLVGASRERVNKSICGVHPARLDRPDGPPLPDPEPAAPDRARSLRA